MINADKRDGVFDGIEEILPSLRTIRIVLLVMTAILAALLSYIYIRMDDPNLISKTKVFGVGTVSTVLHDGHWWVVRSSGKTSAIHHPDCPCHKKL